MLDHQPTSPLHDLRLELITAQIVASGARSFLDLGCGPGELIARLQTYPQLERIVGIDTSSFALAQSRTRFAEAAPRIQIVQASFTEADARLAGFDSAALIETIEHVDPHRLGEAEHAVFACMRPERVWITTPNKDYNPLHGLAAGQLRHPDHRFEWSRSRFREWGFRIARKHGYQVRFAGIGDPHPELGCSTQMLTARRIAA